MKPSAGANWLDFEVRTAEVSAVFADGAGEEQRLDIAAYGRFADLQFTRNRRLGTPVQAAVLLNQLLDFDASNHSCYAPKGIVSVPSTCTTADDIIACVC